MPREVCEFAGLRSKKIDGVWRVVAVKRPRVAIEEPAKLRGPFGTEADLWAVLINLTQREINTALQWRATATSD